MKRAKKFNIGGMGDDYLSSDDAKNLILAAEREDVERIGEDFAKTLPKAEPAAAKSTSFKEAFAEARRSGDKTFEWNGKKYTTELAGEKKAKPMAKATDTGDELTRMSRRAPAPASRTFAERQEDASTKMRLARAGQIADLKKMFTPSADNPRLRRERLSMQDIDSKFKSGGKVSSASKRADGCAQRGKTRGRMV